MEAFSINQFSSQFFKNNQCFQHDSINFKDIFIVNPVSYPDCSMWAAKATRISWLNQGDTPHNTQYQKI